MRRLEEPGLGGDGAREGSLLVSEQLGLEQVPRQTGAVQIDERLAGAAALRVDPARQHPLAGSGFSLDQDRQVALRRRVRVARQRVNRGAASAEKIQGRRRGSARGVQPATILLVLDDAIDHDRDRCELQRFGEKLLGAFLDRRDRELDRAVAGDEDHGDLDARTFQLSHQVESRAIGERVVHQEHVGKNRVDQRERGGAGVGFLDLIPVGLEVRPHSKANAWLVFHNQDSTFEHARSRFLGMVAPLATWAPAERTLEQGGGQRLRLMCHEGSGRWPRNAPGKRLFLMISTKQ